MNINLKKNNDIIDIKENNSSNSSGENKNEVNYEISNRILQKESKSMVKKKYLKYNKNKNFENQDENKYRRRSLFINEIN